MLGLVPRAILVALLVTFICAVPSSARVGSGKIAFVTADGLYTVNPDGTGRVGVHHNQTPALGPIDERESRTVRRPAG
jgi:hypothetical protein